MPRIPVPAGIMTKIFILDDNALPMIPEVLTELWSGRTPWIVADGNTWQAAGEKVQKILEDAGLSPAVPLILPAAPKPHPDYALACQIADMIQENFVPVAVGSGVINDLVKTAAGIKNIGYCCVPTAPSVDGYTSKGSAMSVYGSKKTVPCPAPMAVVADKEVLLSAPAEMAAAGYADLAAKVVAGADWIIADALKQDPIIPATWEVVQKDLREWLADSTDLKAVFMGLAATGYAMQQHDDSRPASGSEHMFSHVWEMEGLQFNGEEVSHGFKVSVGTIITLKLMQYFLSLTAEKAQALAEAPQSWEEREKEINELLKQGCYGDAPAEFSKEKFLPPAEAMERRKEIYAVWDSLQEAVAHQLGDQQALVASLKNASCPTEPEEIGLSREQFIHGIFTAQLIRKRYNILELLFDAGLLKKAVKEMF